MPQLRGLVGLHAVLLFGVASATAPSLAATPDWVNNCGNAARYPAKTHLTGFGVGEEARATEQAKNQAAADLAKRITVRIEQETSDVSMEKDGDYHYAVAAVTRATTDVRLTGLTYETHKAGGKVYVLAVLERKTGAAAQRRERDQAVKKVRACLASAQRQVDAKKQGALRTYLSCRVPIAQGLEYESIASAISGRATADNTVQDELVQVSRTVDERVQTLLRRPSSSLEEAAENLATQLGLQGVGKGARLTVASLTYGTTPFSSVLGRHFAGVLESSLAGTRSAGSNKIKGPLVVKGTYFESSQEVTFRIMVREAKAGRAVAGAQASLPLGAVPQSLPLRPQNFEQALRDQRLLAHGEEVSGKLRVEVWTNKGDRGLIFQEGEELKIYMRVNQPAYVRLVYLLANKAKVPLEQAYFIDASKVNKAVEYPDVFEVAPPFGIEQIFAVAFTEKPKPLPTVTQVVDGEEYKVVTETETLVRHRGLKRKKKGLQTSEAVVSVTTMGRR